MILNSHWGEQIKKLFIYEPFFDQRLLEAASLSEEKSLFILLMLLTHVKWISHPLSSALTFNSSAFQTYSIIQIQM